MRVGERERKRAGDAQQRHKENQLTARKQYITWFVWQCVKIKSPLMRETINFLRRTGDANTRKPTVLLKMPSEFTKGERANNGAASLE